MKTRLLPLFLCAALACVPCVRAAEEPRHPYVSGSFYPSDPERLSRMVRERLAAAGGETPDGRLVGLIEPHAGYEYSGASAAHGYKLLAGRSIGTVILLGPYHKARFPGASVWTGGAWETPLGTVEIDTELARAIASEDPSFAFNPAAHLAEHSLETQLPFLQSTLAPGFRIVPILVSDASIGNARKLGRAIAKHVSGRDVLCIASTDLSHYENDATALELDAFTSRLIRGGDPGALSEASLAERAPMCGDAAVVTLLAYLQETGPSRIRLLHYAHSGQVTGDNGRVVGYGTFGAFRDSASGLNRASQETLLKLARATLEAHVRGRPLPEPDRTDPELERERAVFVTLKKDGALRGCIGRILPEESLADAVRAMTVESASRDPRFRPVRPDEAADLSIEISVLEPPRRVGSADEIELPRHGVIVRRGERSGVFLPKVAEETGWTRQEYLSELCTQKAGLESDCWKDPGTQLYVFTSQDFGE